MAHRPHSQGHVQVGLRPPSPCAMPPLPSGHTNAMLGHRGSTDVLVSKLKQKFYGSLNSMSFKAKPRSQYKPEYALKVFQACLEPEIKPFWSRGYLANITEWVEVRSRQWRAATCGLW